MEKQSQILQAAITVFCQQGFEAASMQTIADCAGVAKGTLYLYYQSKQDLIEKTFDFCNESDVAACQQGLDDVNGALNKLCLRMRNALRWAMAHPEMNRIERMFLTENQKGRYCAQKRHVQVVDQILKDGIAQGELRHLPCDLLGEMFFWLGLALLNHVAEHPEKLEDEAFWTQADSCVFGLLQNNEAKE